MYEQLKEKNDRFEELESLLQDPEVLANGARYRDLVKEHGTLAKLVAVYREFLSVAKELAETRDLAGGDDAEMAELAREELPALEKREAEVRERLEDQILSAEEGGVRDAILEIRAGTGGEEAALFTADLFRMYSKFAENRGWKVEVLDSSPSDLDGLRDITIAVKGEGAFRELRFESGGHRVQRVPKTESQGRIHTSAATVAVMPEAEEIDVAIDPNDLRVDTMRAGGPGGQSVNKTSSAVRITHEPTGLVVKCQDEKSQHKNRAKALRILRSRLLDMAQREEAEKRGDLRRSLIGSGDRSERIRTYNFPQNRVTDHRIGENFSLELVIEGHLDKLLGSLLMHDRRERLEGAKG